MNRLSAVATLLLVIALAAGTAYAQPTLPKETIPADAAPEVRAQIERMYERDAAARVDAVTTLGEMGDKAAAAVPFLIDMLKDNSSMVSLPPTLTARYMPPDTITLVGRDFVMDFQCRSAEVALARVGEPAVKPLLEAARHDNEAVRDGAVGALGLMKTASATDALARLFKDPGYQDRKTVVQALGNRGDPQAVELLTTALEDPSPDVRKAAETALAKARGQGKTK